MSLVQVLRSLWAQVTAGKVAAAFVLYWLLKRIKRAYTKVLLAKKIILVTGGANGIGLQTCLQLAKRKATVVIWDIDATALEAARGTIMEAVPDSTVHTHRVDLSDRHQIYAAATRIRDEVGPVYGVINNAGIVSGKEQLVDVPDEYILRTFAVNTFASFWTAKAFLPDMIKRNKGHFLVVSSAAGFFGSPLMVDYSSSKFASVGLMVSLRMELQHAKATGVNTTVVCPAHVDTNLFKGFSTLLPSLKAKDVASRIVEALEKKDEMVMMPRLLYLCAIAQSVLPLELLDIVNRLMGVYGAMTKFQSSAAQRVHRLMEAGTEST